MYNQENNEKKTKSLDAIASSSATFDHTYSKKPKVLENGQMVYAMCSNSNGIYKIGRILTKSAQDPEYTVLVGKKKYKVSAKHLSIAAPQSGILTIGARVVAMYSDEKVNSNDFYAGVVAESPENTNKNRYLIFFDEGFTQYVNINKVYVVYEVSTDVIDDIPQDMKHFIHNYLKNYSKRTMLNFQIYQTVSIEWNSTWCSAKVTEIDCSLVKVCYDICKQSEWIYRGSTRFETLYLKEKLNNEQSLKEASKKTSLKSYLSERKLKERKDGSLQEVEMNNNEKEKLNSEIYLSDLDLWEGISQNNEVGTTSTTSEADKRKFEKVKSSVTLDVGLSHSSNKKQNVAAVVENEHDGDLVCKFRVNLGVDVCKFKSHRTCNPSCLTVKNHCIRIYENCNPFLIPMICGWRRLRAMSNKKKAIFYRTPCGRRLRAINEVNQYLLLTNSELTIDLFTFDFRINCFTEFVPKNVKVRMEDFSYKKEKRALSFVNSLDKKYPNFVEYSTKYYHAKDVNINLDPDFLVCCDCDDNCLDSLKCACQQLTLDSFQRICPQTRANFSPYFYGRRLMEHVVSGVYECNIKCKCSKRCVNRVVQNDLKLRLQIFQTKNCGWGVRCLDDIPQGCFISLFTGQILTEQKANKDGTEFGDEYLADLDYIEVCENAKEGYEADVIEPEDTDQAISNVENDLIDKGGSGKKKPKLDENDDVFEENETENKCTSTSGSNNTHYKLVRTLYGDVDCYTLDAKLVGNVGRYLNHSCSPNVFVQTVFVDTHDIRFPWVAFFANDYIPAGTELRWDYNYLIGSVPGKVIICHCGSIECRGRLL